jgi:DNA-binding MarR family transcriptional regulator
MYSSVMNRMMDAFATWTTDSENSRRLDFHRYACNIASARYVTRRVLRIVAEQAKREGLDPLQHQALLQIYGTPAETTTTVSGLATRLDVPGAFASRLTTQLQRMGYVERHPIATDRRAVAVIATEAGIATLRRIDDGVHEHVAYFQHQLSENERLSALAIYAFYVGLDSESAIGDAIRTALNSSD